ncbi:MAG: biopolymer transporter ExbD [Bacteroidia bacterium]|nr:biopolymer transporter ExbD [Bacteroidia bacterium]
MPKVKIKRKSTAIDMTAMCDVAFLLLTFFMLTSNFTQKEPVKVSTPASISEIKLPDRNVISILVDAKGKVFLGADGQDNRVQMLTKMGAAYNVTFTAAELKEFSLINKFGVPITMMKTYLALKSEERDLPQNALGIPCDSLDNQFKSWVSVAKTVNSEYRIAIKADQATTYPVIKKLMGTLQDINENRYNLLTSLKNAPDYE